jgi:hypothetical protein
MGSAAMTDWMILIRSHGGADTIDTNRHNSVPPSATGNSVDCVDCVRGVKSEKSERLDPAPVDAVALRDCYEERAAICQFDGHRDRSRAEARAWNQVAFLWHRQHGSRIPSDLCAGCGKPIRDEAEVQLLPHGERAHADGSDACIQAYGRRRKSEAATALTAIGIPTPAIVVAEIGTSIEVVATS